MPKRQKPTDKTTTDDSEAQEAKEVEPILKQTKKFTKTMINKTEIEAPDSQVILEQFKFQKSTIKEERTFRNTRRQNTQKIQEEKSQTKGEEESKRNEENKTEEGEVIDKQVKKKVVTKGRKGKAKKGDEEEEQKESEHNEGNDENTEKGKFEKDEGEKVIVSRVEGKTKVQPKNPKKLTRDRSLIEDILDDYEHNTREIALGDGKIDSKEILISSWNVNSFSALIKKPDLHNYMKEVQPEIICFNEIKLTDANCEEIGTKWVPEGYNGYFNCCKIKKGYAGVAIVSKHKPISVKFDLGIKKHDLEGRTITLEFEHFYLVSCYVPNAGDKLVGLAYRTQEWDPDLRNYLGELKKKKHVILCGDLNCAHKEIDIYEPKGHDKSACFTPQERKEFTLLLESGFVDTFRHFYPDDQRFSYFTVRFPKFRSENKGWRLDYFLVDEEGMSAVKDSTINDEIYGSDHLPIELRFNPNFDN